MAQITKAVITDLPTTVVVDAHFQFNVTFHDATDVIQAINKGTFKASNLVGNIEFVKITDATTPNNYLVEAVFRSAETQSFILNLQSIADTTTPTPAVSGDVNIDAPHDVNVLNSPTFSAQTHLDATFDVTQLFSNPIPGNLVYSTTTPPLPNGIMLDVPNQRLVVPDLNQEMFFKPIGSNKFVDVIIPLTATNQAGSVSIEAILRVTSALPTSNIS